MTQIFLIRHAQNEWVKTGRLAGWTPEVHLNDEGRKQAAALGERLASAKLTAVYSSPLERAIETAEAITTHYENLTVQIEEGVGEVRFGDWTGQKLRQLSRTRLWRVVQGVPSFARFPGGESFYEVQVRLVSSLERIRTIHSTGRVAIVAHSDVIKLVFAYYAGIHIDLFQRLTISPASISIVHLGSYGPRVIRMNDTAHYDLFKSTET